MKNKQFDPFKNLKLDKEEKEIEKAFENDEFVSDKNWKKEKKLYQKYAALTLKKIKNPIPVFPASARTIKSAKKALAEKTKTKPIRDIKKYFEDL